MPPNAKNDGTDADGFVALASLRARAKSAATPGDFVKSCPGPALLVLGAADDGGGVAANGAASGSKVLIVTVEGGKGDAAARRYHGRAAFVAKRPGNPFPNMISLGRSTSNDLVLALDTISKLHGYFL